MVDVSALSPNDERHDLAQARGQEPGRLGEGPRRARARRRRRARRPAWSRASPTRSCSSPRAATPGIALGHGLPTPRLPPQGGAARQRVARAAPAPRSSSAPRSSTRPGAEGSNGAVRLARSHSPSTTPSGRSSTSTRTPRIPQAHYSHDRPRDPRGLPRDHALRRGARHLGHAHGRRHVTCRSTAPTCRSGPSSRPPARWSTDCATSTTATSRRSSSTTDGEELLDRRVVVRPRESIEWTRRLAELGLFVGLSSGAIMAGAVRCAEAIARGRGRHHRRARRPTTAGSISRPARGATTSTTSSSAPSRTIYF